MSNCGARTATLTYIPRGSANVALERHAQKMHRIPAVKRVLWLFLVLLRTILGSSTRL